MDKLADGKDIENFEKIQKDVIKKSFDDGSVHEIEQRILNIFTKNEFFLCLKEQDIGFLIKVNNYLYRIFFVYFDIDKTTF